MMCLTKQLILVTHGSQSTSVYLAKIRELVNELALIGIPIEKKQLKISLFTHLLMGSVQNVINTLYLQ